MFKLALAALTAAVVLGSALHAEDLHAEDLHAKEIRCAGNIPLEPRDESHEGDIAFLLDAFEEKAGELLKQKKIDWKQVRKEFTKRAKDIESDQELIVVAAELVARLQDGHAGLRDVTVDMGGYGDGPIYSCGLDLFEFDGKWYVKRASGDALKSGIEAGWEVVKIDGEKAVKWMDAAQQRLVKTHGFSTEAAARFATGTWGLKGPDGKSVGIEFKAGRKKKKVNLQWGSKAGGGNSIGPVVFPEGLEELDREVAWTRLPSGYGYLWLGRIPSELPTFIDTAIAGLGDECTGMVLDFRSSNGGTYDRDALLGRFVPKGQVFGGEKSAGPKPFVGHVVVLIDPSTISAAETIVGELKEDGRAYLIGPGGTHGASGTKEQVAVPSGKLAARFVIRSHKSWMNGGRGVEGIGIAPHEIVAYDPKAIAQGIDPCIARAEEILKEGPPKKDVTYVPPKAD